MKTLNKSLLLVGFALLAVLLMAGPASADTDEGSGEDTEQNGGDAEDSEGEDAEEGGGETEEGEASEEDEEAGGKIQLGSTPRDQIALILFGALILGGGLAFLNARRQLKGERPQATGEFRWR